MSRHSKFVNTPRWGKCVLVVGFDRPLQEYFVQLFRTDAPEEEEDVVFSISSRTTIDPHPDYPGKFHYSNGELVEIMTELGADEAHITAVVLDLPF
jgi:hypothetical protein